MKEQEENNPNKFNVKSKIMSLREIIETYPVLTVPDFIKDFPHPEGEKYNKNNNKSFPESNLNGPVYNGTPPNSREFVTRGK